MISPPNPDPTTSRNQSRCYNCHKIGHVSQECPKPKMTICYNCHKEGHKTFECQEGKRCHSCNTLGHLARDCPMNKLDDSSVVPHNLFNDPREHHSSVDVRYQQNDVFDNGAIHAYSSIDRTQFYSPPYAEHPQLNHSNSFRNELPIAPEVVQTSFSSSRVSFSTTATSDMALSPSSEPRSMHSKSHPKELLTVAPLDMRSRTPIEGAMPSAISLFRDVLDSSSLYGLLSNNVWLTRNEKRSTDPGGTSPAHIHLSNANEGPLVAACSCCGRCVSDPQCSCGCLTCTVHEMFDPLRFTNVTHDDIMWKNVQDNPRAWLQTIAPTSVSGDATLFPIPNESDRVTDYENSPPWKTSGNTDRLNQLPTVALNNLPITVGSIGPSRSSIAKYETAIADNAAGYHSCSAVRTLSHNENMEKTAATSLHSSTLSDFFRSHTGPIASDSNDGSSCDKEESVLYTQLSDGSYTTPDIQTCSTSASSHRVVVPTDNGISRGVQHHHNLPIGCHSMYTPQNIAIHPINGMSCVPSCNSTNTRHTPAALYEDALPHNLLYCGTVNQLDHYHSWHHHHHELHHAGDDMDYPFVPPTVQNFISQSTPITTVPDSGYQGHSFVKNSSPMAEEQPVSPLIDGKSPAAVVHHIVHHRHEVVHSYDRLKQLPTPSTKEGLLQRLEDSLSSFIEIVNEVKKALIDQPEEILKDEVSCQTASLEVEGSEEETRSGNLKSDNRKFMGRESLQIENNIRAPQHLADENLSAKLASALQTKVLPAYRILPLSEHGRCGCCYVCDINTQLEHHQCGCLCPECSCSPTEFSARKRCGRIKNAPKSDAGSPPPRIQLSTEVEGQTTSSGATESCSSSQTVSTAASRSASGNNDKCESSVLRRLTTESNAATGRESVACVEFCSTPLSCSFLPGPDELWMKSRSASYGQDETSCKAPCVVVSAASPFCGEQTDCQTYAAFCSEQTAIVDTCCSGTADWPLKNQSSSSTVDCCQSSCDFNAVVCSKEPCSGSAVIPCSAVECEEIYTIS